jgi:hypothetical protein
MKKLFVLIMILFTLSLSAEECFKAQGKVFSDAQHLRKVALSMGWKVYKPVSIVAGTLIKTKVKLYPEDNVNVCLRKNRIGEVEIRVQSESVDAGTAHWNVIFGKRVDGTSRIDD